MEEGQIARWVKNEGDTYEANETLAEVDTDKATMEMTALTGGTLLKILKGEGETALLGEAIAITGNTGEDISALLSEVASNGAKAAPKEEISAPVEKPAETPKAETRTAASVPSKVQAIPTNGRMIVSPIAARMIPI